MNNCQIFSRLIIHSHLILHACCLLSTIARTPQNPKRRIQERRKLSGIADANVIVTQCSLKTNEIRLVLDYIHPYYSQLHILFSTASRTSPTREGLPISTLYCLLDRKDFDALRHQSFNSRSIWSAMFLYCHVPPARRLNCMPCSERRGTLTMNISNSRIMLPPSSLCTCVLVSPTALEFGPLWSLGSLPRLSSEASELV